MVAHLDNANVKSNGLPGEIFTGVMNALPCHAVSQDTEEYVSRRIAQFLHIAGGAEDHEYALAIAWVAVNRMRKWNLPVESALAIPWQPGGVDLGRMTLKWGVRPELLAISTTVMSCLAQDPTSGALAFHYHWEDPIWARGSQPHALIGPCFFYQSLPNTPPAKNMLCAGHLFT